MLPYIINEVDPLVVLSPSDVILAIHHQPLHFHTQFPAAVYVIVLPRYEKNLERWIFFLSLADLTGLEYQTGFNSAPPSSSLLSFFSALSQFQPRASFQAAFIFARAL